MILIALALAYMAVVKKYEPLLLLPLAFGMLIANVVFIIKCAIESHKEKKRKRKEEQNNQ